jgi:hypothetical protein
MAVAPRKNERSRNGLPPVILSGSGDRPSARPLFSDFQNLRLIIF